MKYTVIVLVLLLTACQQGAKKQKMPETKVQRMEKFEGEANQDVDGKAVDSEENLQDQEQYSSALRPNEPALFNRTYTDTLEFNDYNDDYDYRYLNVRKNGKEVSLVYNWDWFDNERYNFRQGDLIAVTWKLNSVAMAGDEEVIDIVEMAIDAKKIASGNKPITFLSREAVYDEGLQSEVSSILINASFCHNITDPEKAALGFIAFDIGSECEWGYDSKGDRVLWCRVVSALNLDHQCSEKQLNFLRKWFSEDPAALEKLLSCPTIPNTATVQTTFDEILIQTNEAEKTITVKYKVTGINMRESQSWHYSQTDVFEYGSEHIILIDSKKSDLTEEETNMNPDAAENIDPQNFVLALRDHIIQAWEKDEDFETLTITFSDNVLNIKDSEGFTLSNYDFNEMVINGTENPQVIYLTVGNEGGGGGGNVVLEETYSLTVIDAEEFDIRHVETK